jgi:hypothetical protein
MNSYGIVQSESEGGREVTLSQIIDYFNAEHIHPTHFLSVSFEFSQVDDNTQTLIGNKFHDLITAKQYSHCIKRKTDDEIHIKWNSVRHALEYTNSFIYYTNSRLAETYVLQLTRVGVL